MKFKAAISAALVAAMLCTGAAFAQKTELLAFPGAEGGGKYTQGARGASQTEVYHVTTLEPEGAGSLTDAVSREGRVIVFDVGGTIHLKQTLKIPSSNLTILGQTAPGDGITIAGGDIVLSSGVSNIIVRYLRIRPSDINGGEPDGLGGRWNHNIILDHCSVSWSVDEGLTLYAGSREQRDDTSSNVTMQYCIGAESLRMSNHIKGAHGYGAIWGGENASYHHNLLAHHDSRSPRLDRELLSTDIVNNVIYDWGITNSAYGAEPYSYNNKMNRPSNVNWVGNYHKYGPGTAQGLRSRIFEPSNGEKVTPLSNFYMKGNFVCADEAVTADNTKGVYKSELANFLSEPVDMGEYKLPEQTAQEAYEDVLANAGATLPRRDAIDARIAADVKNQTGRIINRTNEVGGFLDFETVSRTFEIPEAWKQQNGMGKAKEADIVSSGTWKGYTWIEAYVNDWTAQQSTPSNPDVTVVSPAVASVGNTINGYTVDNGDWAVSDEDKPIRYTAYAKAKEGTTITGMALYDGEEKIAFYEGGVIDTELLLTPGTHYLTCRAENDKKEGTQSPTSIVYVNRSGDAGKWNYAEVGTRTAFSEKGAGNYNISGGVYTVSGSGKIGAKADSCGYLYKGVKGDFSFTAKTGSIPKYENSVVAGLMVRETLEPGARTLMLADGWLKYGENIQVLSRSQAGGAMSREWLMDKEGKEINNEGGYSTQTCPLPSYLKIERKGDAITLSVSDDGKDFTGNARQPRTYIYENLPETLYVGIAVDSAQSISVKPYFTMADFSEVVLNGEAYPILEKASVTKREDGITVTADVSNIGMVQSGVNAMAAVYKNGTLIGADMAEITIEADAVVNVQLKPSEAGDEIRVMIWNRELSPVCTAVTLKNGIDYEI